MRELWPQWEQQGAWSTGPCVTCAKPLKRRTQTMLDRVSRGSGSPMCRRCVATSAKVRHDEFLRGRLNWRPVEERMNAEQSGDTWLDVSQRIKPTDA